MNDRPRYSLRLNIRSTSPSLVLKKQPTSSVGGKERYITVNKESNKRSKGYGVVSKKYHKKIFKTQSRIKLDR